MILVVGRLSEYFMKLNLWLVGIDTLPRLCTNAVLEYMFICIVVVVAMGALDRGELEMASMNALAGQ
jgi:hypothetical protein